MTRIGYHDGLHPLNNCSAMFLEHLQRSPDRVVLHWASRASIAAWHQDPTQPLGHQRFTYAQLFEMAGKIAHCLHERGLRQGDCVIVFVPMIPYLYTSLFALQLLGAIPVFLDTWARRQQLGLVAKIVNAKAMISVEIAYDLCEGEPILDAIQNKIVLGPVTRAHPARLEDFLDQPKKITEPCPVEKEHTGLITFTTGSSGVPKGANRTHRFLAAQHYALDHCLPYREDDVDLPVFPVFSLNNIGGGVPTVLPAIDVANPSEMDGELLVRQAEDCGVTCMTLNPSLLVGISRFCKKQGKKLTQIRRVFAGGAAVSRDMVLEFNEVAPAAELMVAYGSTEVEPIAHIVTKDILATPSLSDQDPELVDEGVIVGTFADGLSYKFLRISRDPIEIRAPDEWKQWEVKSGEVGEIIVAGEHVCGEYYNDTEGFRRAKIRDPQGVIWHRTGDVGRLDKNGQLWLVGRVHNTITRKGGYVFPVRAEIVLKRLPFVQQAAYLGIPDKDLGEKSVCVLAPADPGALGDEGRLAPWRKEVLRVMGKNGIPVDEIVFYREIPLDPRHRSKVEYDQLRNALKKEGLV